MFSFSKKKNPHETCCLVCHVIVATLLFLASIAALVGVVMSHYSGMMLAQDVHQSAMMMFGTNADSLSLVAFVLCTTLWVKALKGCMSECEACGVIKPSKK